MAACDRCNRQVPQRFKITVYDETQDLRGWWLVTHNYWYLEQTGEVTIRACIDCFVAITGSPPADIQPPENLFHIRTLQSAVAVEIAYSLFEHCGYQVRHHGYEYSTPEWMSSLKSGDANPAASKIKSQPDLLVFDSEINDVYEVEVKTTNQPSSRWRIRKADIDTLRYYHSGAILMVYVQYEHDFYVGPLRRIDWENIHMYTDGSHEFYEVDLGSSFIKPTTVFNQVTPNAYFPFLEGVKRTLAAF